MPLACDDVQGENIGGHASEKSVSEMGRPAVKFEGAPTVAWYGISHDGEVAQDHYDRSQDYPALGIQRSRFGSRQMDGDTQPHLVDDARHSDTLPAERRPCW